MGRLRPGNVQKTWPYCTVRCSSSGSGVEHVGSCESGSFLIRSIGNKQVRHLSMLKFLLPAISGHPQQEGYQWLKAVNCGSEPQR